MDDLDLWLVFFVPRLVCVSFGLSTTKRARSLWNILSNNKIEKILGARDRGGMKRSMQGLEKQKVLIQESGWIWRTVGLWYVPMCVSLNSYCQHSEGAKTGKGERGTNNLKLWTLWTNRKQSLFFLLTMRRNRNLTNFNQPLQLSPGGKERAEIVYYYLGY